MTITRVFYEARLVAGDALRLPEEEARHVFKVLRARAGDEIEVVDAGGRLFVAGLSGGREAKVLEERPAVEDGGDVTLYQAVPKGRHMDLVVEKATELGVGRVVPLATERGVMRLSPGDGKVERWRRVARAAARQSLRLRVPEVGEPFTFAEAARAAGEGGVLLHNGPGLQALEDVLTIGPTAEGPVGLFVGPEGGWGGGELALAEDVGLRFASLGPFRLRSETAGMVAVARGCVALERVRSVARSG